MFVLIVVFHLKEELLGMKRRVRVVVVENEKLHEELKAKMVEDTLKEYTLADSTVPTASLWHFVIPLIKILICKYAIVIRLLKYHQFDFK